MRTRAILLILALAAAPLGQAAAHPDARPTTRPRAAALPAAPPARIARLIGQYGAPGRYLDVSERDGQLYAEGPGIARQALVADGGRWRAGRVVIGFEPGGTGATLDGRRLPRVDLGALAEAKVRAGVRADPDRLRAQALAATPPAEPAPKRRTDLVDLKTVDPAIRFDIRYATRNNFLGLKVYDRPAAYLQRPAAEALGRVAAALKPQGYGLLVHDAYRPWFVTKMFWDATPPESRDFVADPSKGSRHNRGAAVDLTLYELATGRVVEMPSRYDEFSPRAFADYPGGTSRQRAARDLLRRAMEKEGFTVVTEEWWHYDFQNFRDWAIGNRTFDQLSGN